MTADNILITIYIIGAVLTFFISMWDFLHDMYIIDAVEAAFMIFSSLACAVAWPFMLALAITFIPLGWLLLQFSRAIQKK